MVKLSGLTIERSRVRLPAVSGPYIPKEVGSERMDDPLAIKGPLLPQTFRALTDGIIAVRVYYF